jgi:hypothetical protein
VTGDEPDAVIEMWHPGGALCAHLADSSDPRQDCGANPDCSQAGPR